jgi:cation diffusion facilitator CzcD-associated flavoprotein CzcO
MPDKLPIAVIGAGPIGLAASVHLIERGLPVKVYEAGSGVGASIRDWSHVHIFTPWRYCVDGCIGTPVEKLSLANAGATGLSNGS